MTRLKRARAPITLCLGLSALTAAFPAHADHVGPSGGTGSGASSQVFGPDTLAAGHAAFGLRLTYLRPNQRSDQNLETLAGEHIHAHNSRCTLNASAGVAYGLTDRLTLSAELPFVRRDHLREGEHSHSDGIATNEVVRLGNVSGIGDASLLAKYRILDEHVVKVALIGGLKVPTGSTHKVSREEERLETEHQPGSGSWDPLIGAAISSELGSTVLTSSLLYQFAGKGAQFTRLGDRIVGGIALSHPFGRAGHHHQDDDSDEEHHEHHGAHAKHRHSSWEGFVEIAGEWEGRQKVDSVVESDSGGKAVWISPGARYIAANGYSVSAALGFPLWQQVGASHPDNKARLTLALSKAF
jgi:hypothetical protein